MFIDSCSSPRRLQSLIEVVLSNERYFILLRSGVYGHFRRIVRSGPRRCARLVLSMSKSGESMNIKVRMIVGFAPLAVAVTLSGTASAQHAQPAQQTDTRVSARAAAHDATLEVVVQGTVLNYSENSISRPNGAHVTVQTPAGPVDVHLGPSSYLRSHHFSLAAGDSVRFVGAMSSADTGSVLLARIAQKGSESIALRSTRGFLLATGATRSLSNEHRAQAPQNVSAR